ncbi:erythrocyte membrane protein 1 (PfEMP1), putative [Plasmodium sp.]|nr:erythrocyte membrane protein 1 (PfEMP1), putative [Plasmodium sp.]
MDKEKGSNSCEYQDTCYDRDIESKDPCVGDGKGEDEENKCDIGKEWKSAKTVYQTRVRDKTSERQTSDVVLQNVYLPTRRQCICTRGLGITEKVTDINKLLKQLMEISIYQGYNLGKYYKGKEDTQDTEGGGRGGEEKKKEKEREEHEEEQSGHNTTTYNVSECNALKYSFYDLRDIILGYDHLVDKGTEKNLKKVFKSGGKEEDGKPGSGARQQWWKQNEQCVWEAMKCGYKQGYSGAFGRGEADQHEDKIPDGCKNDAPNDAHFPIANISNDGKSYQFLRWFAEWSEDFCKQRKKQKKKLEEACKCYKCGQNGKGETGDGNDTCDNSGCEDQYSECESRKECEKEKEKCTAQCEAYYAFIKKWQEQYKEQNKKYTDDKTENKYKYHAVAKNQSTAQKYLKEQLNNVCTSENVGGGCNCMADEESGEQESLPPSLIFPPSGYTDKCSDVKDHEEGSADFGGGEDDAGAGGSYVNPDDEEGGGDKKGKKGKKDKDVDAAEGPSQEAPEGASPPKKEDSSPKEEEQETQTSSSPDGQGPGPGQQPPPPPQQQQSGPEVGEEAGTVSGGEEAGTASGGEDEGSQVGDDSCNEITKNLVSFALETAQFGIKAGFIVGKNLLDGGDEASSGSESDGHSHGSQEGGDSPGIGVADQGDSRSGQGERGPRGSPGERGGGGDGVRGPRSVPPQQSQLSQILGATLPLSVSIALISLSYLLLKKKPKSIRKRLVRVVELPEKVSKTYDRHVGKRYIYVEGNGDTTDTTDTTNITSSSESEYEDINDIYPYKSPKHKTLIEIIMEPRNRDDVFNTHNTFMYQKDDPNDTSITHNTSDIPTNTFISNMLQRKPKDFPNENTIDVNMYMEIQPNILDDIMDEKPFITQIKDRYLHGSEHSYNINWNVPKNTNMITTNNMYIPQYTSRNIYYGIDLICNSLTHKSHTDIYSEILKRKEKELFGTKYT